MGKVIYVDFPNNLELDNDLENSALHNVGLVDNTEKRDIYAEFLEFCDKSDEELEEIYRELEEVYKEANKERWFVNAGGQLECKIIEE